MTRDIYQRGSLGAEDFKRLFGLNDQGLATENYGPRGRGKGSTKTHRLLGTGYMTDDDAKRLLKDDKLQRTWDSISTGDSDGKNEFNSINDLNSLLNKLARDEGQAAPAPAAPAEPTQPSPELVAARGTWDDFERRRGEGSIHFNPTGDGIRDAADYGNRATDDYVNRFVPHLNAQANLEAHEMGDIGNYHLNRFEGEPTELASSDIKDLYKYYSSKISDIG